MIIYGLEIIHKHQNYKEHDFTPISISKFKEDNALFSYAFKKMITRQTAVFLLS